MKKRLFEEVTDSIGKSLELKIFFKPSLLSVRLFTLLIFFTEVKISTAQVELNGFGRYLEFEGTNSLQSIVTNDIDKDGFIDIIGLDESRKILIVYFGKGANLFRSAVRYKLWNSVDKIFTSDLFSTAKGNIISLNRMKGKIEIYTFRYRRLKRTHEIPIGFYPEDLAIDNFNKSLSKEIICFGKNYSGISLIKLSEKSFEIKKIDSTGSYSHVVPVYLNSDDNLDIAAVNSKTQEFCFFFNQGNFRFSKNIFLRMRQSRPFGHPFGERLASRISHLATGDFNEDGFFDLLIQSNESKQITVHYGNGLGGFPNSKVFQTRYDFDFLIVDDFTKDNLPDLLFFNKSTSNFFLKTLSEDHNFNYSIPFFNLNDLISFNIYRTRSQVGIIVSAGTQKQLFTIMNSALSLKQNIFSISSMPINIQAHEDPSLAMNDLIWIDQFDNHLVLLKRNEYNTPERMYRFKLNREFTKYKFHLHRNDLCDFVFYNDLQNFFDYVSIDLSSLQISRKTITLQGRIKEPLFSISEDETPNIAAINQKTNGYFITLINPFKLNQILLDEFIAGLNLKDFSFSLEKRKLIYWEKNERINAFDLVVKTFNSTFTNAIQNDLYSISDESNYQVVLTEFDMNYDRFKDIITFFHSDIDNFAVGFFNQSELNFTREFRVDEIRVTSKSHIVKTKPTKEFLEEIFFYNESSNSIESLLSLKKSPKAFIRSIKKIDQLKSFTISQSLSNKRELIYTTKNSSLFTLEYI